MPVKFTLIVILLSCKFKAAVVKRPTALRYWRDAIFNYSRDKKNYTMSQMAGIKKHPDITDVPTVFLLEHFDQSNATTGN